MFYAVFQILPDFINCMYYYFSSVAFWYWQNNNKVFFQIIPGIDGSLHLIDTSMTIKWYYGFGPEPSPPPPPPHAKACVSRNCDTNARIKFIIDTAIDDLEWKNPIDFGENRKTKMAAKRPFCENMMKKLVHSIT